MLSSFYVTAQAQSYVSANVWGSTGSDNGQFSKPFGITVDTDGYVYVVDNENNRIEKFSNDGAFIKQWGGFGTKDGQLSWPTDIAADNKGYIYVADNANSQVQKFTKEGSFVKKWTNDSDASSFFNSYMPYGIAVDNKGFVYITAKYPTLDPPEYQNFKILKFTDNGDFITAWGGTGSGPGQLNYPKGIAVSAEGSVYVVDSNNCRIQKFTTDGAYVSKWGTFGTEKSQFKYPFGIAVDNNGNVLVTDTNNDRVQKFSSNGTYLTEWGSFGLNKGQLNDPYGIAISKTGDIYVAEYTNDRVQKFTASATASTSPHSSTQTNSQMTPQTGTPIAFDNTMIFGVTIISAILISAITIMKVRKHTPPVTESSSVLNSFLFISHVKEDEETAKQLAKELKKEGYNTWSIDKNAKVGAPKLLEIKNAIEKSQVVIVIISKKSLRTSLLTSEIIRGHESQKPFIPLLLNVSTEEFQKRKPEWYQVVAPSTILSIPSQGIKEILPSLLEGLENIGVKKANQ
jgi:sugar lactone lactonase YvrE